MVEEGGQTNPVGQTPDVNGLEGQGIQAPSNGDEAGSISQGDIKGDLTGTFDKTKEPVLGVIISRIQKKDRSTMKNCRMRNGKRLKRSNKRRILKKKWAT